ncbi:MAG: hypothetical protein US60_C0045G0005 [Microgenomates group bacterium GW2011_GWC1_37_8]|uniref:Uncharacterized protein n=1 Tax=Candidatus Woesebacteria bacterium GW2011_GWB1_38_8 TaxID=1618570 RepID=A0A0G0LE24_9BACT|nr:MAG: hypothetical protein US60_C0045G0005 [Microgenomates group bacterium GW2011_GWC1_37_8]KKQ86175.1 MAG: hypothetical protein UT08_C0001G0041 [Candidatus Woesebacteria bacterium GW2011_GWB1_38_8]
MIIRLKQDTNMIRILFLLTIFISVLISLLELFTYSGFMKKHLFFNINIFLFFGFVLVILLSLKLNEIISLKLGKILFVSAISALTAMIVLTSLELIKYPNFIFSVTHIEIKNFSQLIAYLLSASFIVVVSKKLFKVFKNNVFFSTVFVFLLAVYIFKNCTFVSASINRLLPPALAKPTATYSDKMYYLWSDPYRYLETVKQLTSNNEVVFLPTGTSAQAITGNIGLIRYFLYPRSLSLYDPERSKNGFLVVSPGNELGDGDYTLWPNHWVDSDYYYLINTKDRKVKRIDKDFDPIDLSGHFWALVKI